MTLAKDQVKSAKEAIQKRKKHPNNIRNKIQAEQSISDFKENNCNGTETFLEWMIGFRRRIFISGHRTVGG